MTPEQKQKFVNEIIKSCDPLLRVSPACPSDFGLSDFDDKKCNLDKETCNSCAIYACKKFFKENNL